MVRLIISKMVSRSPKSSRPRMDWNLSPDPIRDLRAGAPARTVGSLGGSLLNLKLCRYKR